METTSFLLEMASPEIEQAIEEERVLIFCVGAIEQHGPHLPVGVDTYIPMEIASRAARKVGAIVAPPVNYGCKSILRLGGGPHFAGSIGLRGTTLAAVVEDIMSEFIAKGWKRILVLDWHGENRDFVFEGINEAVRKGSNEHIKIIKIHDPNRYGMKGHPELESFLFEEDWPGWVSEHAAIWETSAMMAFRPELVDEAKIIDGHPPEPHAYDILPVPGDAAPQSGVFGNATLATREKGERILEAVTEALIRTIEIEFAES